MLRLLLVRHGQTGWNATHRYQGHSDQPLNQAGMDESRRLAARLKSDPVDIIYSSDLQRAAQTAQILAGGRGIVVRPEPRLRELNFGVLEGHTFDEGLQLWPEMINAWVEDPNQPPTGGERMDAFAARVAEFLDGVMQNCADKSVLVVAHGGPLRVIIQSLLAASSETSWWFSLDHCGLSDFLIDDENIIINHINDVGHLTKL